MILAAGAFLVAFCLEEASVREVKIHGTTFLVNSLSRKDASETMEQLLKRVIAQNAEREFKSGSLPVEKDFVCNQNYS